MKLFDRMIRELTTEARELSSQNLEIQVTLRNILQVSKHIRKRMELGVVTCLRQEMLPFKSRWGYTVRSCLKKKEKNHKNPINNKLIKIRLASLLLKSLAFHLRPFHSSRGTKVDLNNSVFLDV